MAEATFAQLAVEYWKLLRIIDRTLENVPEHLRNGSRHKSDTRARG